MPEAGGPATQSGILYQNSVAAVFLGQLCDRTNRPARDRIVRVRLEAPTEVDDVLVTFGDGRRAYVQVKEDVRAGDAAWKRMWQQFGKQLLSPGFRTGVDRVVLHVGEHREEHRLLRELCDRARGSISADEWRKGLSSRQLELVGRISLLLDPELLVEGGLHHVASHAEVVIWPPAEIERFVVPGAMPASDRPAVELFRLLRDYAGEKARFRGTCTAEDVLAFLDHGGSGVRLIEPPDLEAVRDSVRSCGALLRQHPHTFASTRVHIPRAVVGEIAAWLESPPGQDTVGLLLDHAGGGKTVVMRDVLDALETQGIPTLAIKADLQLSGVEDAEQLQARLRLPESVERVMARLATTGPAVVLIDQLDALSLSLARDQRALTVVLDLVARLRLLSGVRLLLSCRTFDRNSDPRLRRIEVAQEFPLQQLTEDEVRATLVAAHVSEESLTPATRQLLQVPLHLHLFLLAGGRDQEVPRRSTPVGIGSLQELYGRVWRGVVLAAEPGSPPATERVSVLQIAVERMHREQRTSLPASLFSAGEHAALEAAARWLASSGIFMAGDPDWSFLHQTFFDYCYARFFAEAGDRLSESVLRSDQGLHTRPQVVHVLEYLRGSNPREYLRELQALLGSRLLRYHLRDLVLRWFGALRDPGDGDWLVARRMLASSSERPRVLAAIRGNVAWFERMLGVSLQILLAQDDKTLDEEVIPYLASMADNAQEDVIAILEPYAGRSEAWDHRVARVLLSIRKWPTERAADLYARYLGTGLGHLHALDDITLAQPRAGCRLLGIVLESVLEAYLQEHGPTGLPYSYSLDRRLEALGPGTVPKAIAEASRVEPKLFLETLLPWLERVAGLRGPPDEKRGDFGWDELSHGWHDEGNDVLQSLITGFTSALVALGRTDPGSFERHVGRLEKHPYSSIQQLLARTYTECPEVCANRAVAFLERDARRLDLGEHQQYETRRLVRAIVPHLDREQYERLETAIREYDDLWKAGGVHALRERGLKQLYLLQEVPPERLTSPGRRLLQELERKFPRMRASPNPLTTEFYTVGSPILDASAQRMSDRAWLKAMAKYTGEVRHADFMRGGARELAGVLADQVKAQPARFRKLFNRVPECVDDSYVSAFIAGLAESDAPAEWVFGAVRCFVLQPGRDLRQAAASALEKRVADIIPDDLIDLLESWVRQPKGDDEIWWEQDGKDPYMGFLNSSRGSACATLSRALLSSREADAKQRLWRLMEFVATDSSVALRAGAVETLLQVLADDQDRAITVFLQLMEGCPRLVRGLYTDRFVYRGFFRSFCRLRPVIETMMHDDSEKVAKRGAELACIVALSKDALESDQARARAWELLERAVAGPASWRRGAARIFAVNIAAPCSAECAKELEPLLDDTDPEVRRLASGFLGRMSAEHLMRFHPLLEKLASARALPEALERFEDFLWERGDLNPIGTLSVLRQILDNPHQSDQGREFWGGEDLFRLVARIYTDPVLDVGERALAMDVFDDLMERYKGRAARVLEEWDRR